MAKNVVVSSEIFMTSLDSVQTPGTAVWVSYSIMLLMTFSDLSQSDRSSWVMWQVPDLGETGVWPGKNGFHKKYKNLDNIAVYLIAAFKSKCKN